MKLNETGEGVEDALFIHSWEWILARERLFSIESHRSTKRILELLKPIGELALLSRYISDNSSGTLKASADRIMMFCWQEMDEGDLLRRVLAVRPDLLIFSTLYGTFYRSGLSNEELHEQIKKMRFTPSYFNVDLPAWRRLDLLHGMFAIGLAKEGDLKVAFNSTWLAGCYEPWTLSEATAYGLTHTIFYMTDYGAVEGLLPEAVLTYLKQWLAVWENNYIDEGNLDLAAEMVMCRRCIGDISGANKFCNSSLANLLEDGAVPGPELGAVGLLFGEEDPLKSVFYQNYHTTLVACMASFMQSSFCEVKRTLQTIP